MTKIKDILIFDVILFILSFAFGLEGALTVLVLEIFFTAGLIAQIMK